MKMPKRIYTIEIEEPLEEEKISEIIVISTKGFSYKASLLPSVNSGLDGSSYEIDLSNYVRNMEDLHRLWSPTFYCNNFMEYVQHFQNITMDLSYNHLTDEYVKNIFIALLDSKLDILREKLVKINIEQNRLTKPGFIELFNFIGKCPNFKELEASINLLGQNNYFELKESGEIPRSIRNTFFYSSI